jgi:hypothetical protein
METTDTKDFQDISNPYTPKPANKCYTETSISHFATDFLKQV